MDFLKYNNVVLFFIILMCVLMSKYILNKTQTEMFMQADSINIESENIESENI
jgi:hypothetical protein